MAKVTITFEDVDNEQGEGVEVTVATEPTPVQGHTMTAAQHMATQMIHLLNENVPEHDEHCSDEHCTHDHDHNELQVPEV